MSVPDLPAIEVLVVEDLFQQRLPGRTMAAVLRQAGRPAQLVHFGSDTAPEAVTAFAQRLRPRLIVFSILFGHRLAENMALAAHLRAAGLTAHLTMAGSLPTFTYRDLLTACPALDTVLLGEPEASIAPLAACLAQELDWTSLPGLAYRAPGVRANPVPGRAIDLESLPYPVRDDGIPAYQNIGFATLKSSRGCYHKCSFCLPCAFHRATSRISYRRRSVAHLVDEIEWLYRKGVRLFLFDDEQFLPPQPARVARVVSFGEELRRRRLNIAFTIKCRPDDVEADLFCQLRDMGLLRVYLGLESGCQATLDVLDKQITVAQNVSALATLHDLGIVVDFSCLAFHPWSTLESIATELDFLAQVQTWVPTAVALHEVECFPGTAIHSRLTSESAQPPAQRALLSWGYVLPDSAAEWMRRAGHIVFAGRHCGNSIGDHITRAWFDVLLARRFRPQAYAPAQALALRRIVGELNAGTLAVWRDMLAFAGQAGLRNAEPARERTSAWSRCVGALDKLASEQLERARAHDSSC